MFPHTPDTTAVLTAIVRKVRGGAAMRCSTSIEEGANPGISSTDYVRGRISVLPPAEASKALEPLTAPAATCPDNAEADKECPSCPALKEKTECFQGASLANSSVCHTLTVPDPLGDSCACRDLVYCMDALIGVRRSDNLDAKVARCVV